jgi:hypothetical protein
LLLKHTSPAFHPYANGPVYSYTDTRIRSLEPRSSLPGQDVILSANQIHQGSEPSEGVRSLEPAVATVHYAPRPIYVIHAAPPAHINRWPFRVACKSLLMTGRPCLAGGDLGDRSDPTPGDLLHPLLLTKLVSPLILSWPVFLTR